MLACCLAGADELEFNEGIQDLISCTSPAAQAGKKLNERMTQLSGELFAAYDKDGSGALELGMQSP